MAIAFIHTRNGNKDTGKIKTSKKYKRSAIYLANKNIRIIY